MGLKSTPKRYRKKVRKGDCHSLMCEFLLFVRMHKECIQLDCVSSHWSEKKMYVVPYQVLYEYAKIAGISVRRLESIFMHLEGWMLKCSVKNTKGEFIAISQEGLKKIRQIKTPVLMN